MALSMDGLCLRAGFTSASVVFVVSILKIENGLYLFLYAKIVNILLCKIPSNSLGAHNCPSLLVTSNRESFESQKIVTYNLMNKISQSRRHGGKEQH